MIILAEEKVLNMILKGYEKRKTSYCVTKISEGKYELFLGKVADAILNKDNK